MRQPANRGQAILELALYIPILVLLLILAFAACATAWTRTAAQSAARAQLLCAGRRLGDGGEPLRRTVAAGGRGVYIRSEKGRANGSFAKAELPVSGLDGRHAVLVDVEMKWEGIHPAGEILPARLARRVEASVDCWDAGSQSGKKVKNVVRALAAVGGLR